MHPLCSWKTCLHSLCQKFPPSVQFRRLFLSELIRQVGGLSLCLLCAGASHVSKNATGRWELFDCSEVLWLSLKQGTSVNFDLLMTPNICDVSTAGGRRLRSSGRAIWCSSWGGRSSRHNRMLQELLTGNTRPSVQQDQAPCGAFYGYV